LQHSPYSLARFHGHPFKGREGKNKFRGKVERRKGMGRERERKGVENSPLYEIDIYDLISSS